MKFGTRSIVQHFVAFPFPVLRYRTRTFRSGTQRASFWTRLAHQSRIRASPIFYSVQSILGAVGLMVAVMGCGGAMCPTGPEITRALEPSKSGETPAGPKSIRAEARVEQWGDGQRIRGTVMMFAKREDSLRFDVMTQFGPASTFTSEAGQFALWDQKENQFFEGRSCAANIERLTGLPLRAHEVVALLYGDPRGLRGNVGDDVTFEEQTCDDGTVSLVFLRARGSLKFKRVEKFERPEDKAPLQIVSISELDDKGQTLWSVVFDDYEKRASYWLPSEIRYRMPERKIDTTIRFKEVAVDVEVPEGAFSQALPPGLKSQQLDCRTADSPI